MSESQVRPTLVMIDRDGEPILMDFGLAWLTHETDARVTQSGAIIGTPAYMSPEQLRAQTVDHRADIFSLGVLLYEMLSGTRPFGGDTTVDTQAAILNTNTRYLHEKVIEYASRLGALLPDPLSVCFFVNSGSEANDLALRLIRAHTGQQDVICVEHGYHGHTQSLIDVSPYKHAGKGGKGAPSWVHTAAMPDPYRGAHRGYGREVGEAYAADVARCVEQANGLAGMIVESMIGCGARCSCR